MGLGIWMASCPEAMGWGFWGDFWKKALSWDLNLNEASWDSDLGESNGFYEICWVSEFRSDAGRSELIFGPGRGQSCRVYERRRALLGKMEQSA